MDQDKIKYYQAFQKKVIELINQITYENGLGERKLYILDELNEKWKDTAPEYMIDAIPQIKDYPEVSLIWAAYLGMGVAHLWDKDWRQYKDRKCLYREFEKVRGFDYMDEYICEILLGMKLKSPEFHKQEDTLRKCASQTISLIKSERIEPQTKDALFIFAKSAEAFYQLGISIEVYRLGYYYQKMKISDKNLKK